MPLSRALLATALLLSACAGKSDADEDGDEEDGGASWTGEPGDRPPLAGCTSRTEADDGMDGSIDREWVIEYSTYVADDGSSPWVAYQFSDVNGDMADYMRSFDDDGCRVYLEYHDDLEGETTDIRWTVACDARGSETLRVEEEEVEGEWVQTKRTTTTYTYDDQDRIVEYVDEIEEAGEEPYRIRATANWVGEIYDRTDFFVESIDGEESVPYYHVEYDIDGDVHTEARVILDEYFGDDAGSLYQTTTWDHDAAGNIIEQIRVAQDGTTATEEWAFDEHGRETMNNVDDPDEGIRKSWQGEWDPEWRRLVSASQVDELDPDGTYDTTYTYDGGWPWTMTAQRDYGPGGSDPASYVRTHDCGSGGIDAATAGAPIGPREAVLEPRTRVELPTRLR